MIHPSVPPSDWEQVIGVAVLDCAQEENFDICKEFGIKFYPTFKVLRLPARRVGCTFGSDLRPGPNLLTFCVLRLSSVFPRSQCRDGARDDLQR